MAVKSIVEIDVQDAAFQKFSEAFKKYTDLLDKTPPAWASVATTAKATTVTMEGLTAALLAQAEFAQLLRTEGEKTTKAVTSQASAWRDMARTTKSVGSHIAGATRDLLKWASITGLVSGLLGAGGLWGIERLATSAGNQRRSSLGLGISPGQQRSFNTNFGRLVDTGSFIGGVNEALHDVTKRSTLFSGGLTPGDIQGKDTGQVSVALLQSIAKIIDATPDALLGNVIKARRLDQFGITVEDAERIKNTPQSERADYFKRYAADIQSLQLTKDQQKAWQDLQVQLHRAGGQIETTFIRGLAPLAEPLALLSDAFQRLVTTVLDAAKKNGWFDKLGQGLDWLATKIGDPKFESDVEWFVIGVGKMAAAIGGFVTWVAGKLPGSAPSAAATGQGLSAVNPFAYRPFDRGPLDFDYDAMSGFSAPGQAPKFGGIERQFGLPSGLLGSVEQLESSGGRDTRTSSAGAMGPMQFLPATWRQYGAGGNVMDEGDSARGTARYFQKLLTEFQGDIGKAAAGYNWGEGNVEKDVRQYGANWRAHLPPETQNYVAKILAAVGGNTLGARRPVQVNVTIHDSPGGNPVAAASQLQYSV